MTAIVLAALFAGAPPAAAARPPADIRVTVTDVGGATDAGLADALARTLAEAGLTASPAHRRSDDCADECVYVSVRKLEDRGFLVEARARRAVARMPVTLGPTASSFDQVHALAIEAELLAERVRPPRRRPAPKAQMAAQPAPAPSPPANVATDADERPPRMSPYLRSSTAGMTTAAAAASPAPALQTQAPPPVAPTEERLALNVASMILSDTAGDLFMKGATIGLRLRLTHRLDARASVSLLHAENIDAQAGAKLDILPLALAAAVEVPGIPSLRLGGGVEGLVVGGGDSTGLEPPWYWSIGLMSRLEHRYAIRSFALMSSLQVALHPKSWNTAGNAGPLVTVPPWTVAASLGLEFRIF